MTFCYEVSSGSNDFLQILVHDDLRVIGARGKDWMGIFPHKLTLNSIVGAGW